MSEKMQCSAAGLVKALSRLSAVYEQKTTVASSGHVRLLSDGARLVIYCTDYRVSAETALECTGRLDPLVLPGKKLIEIARSFGAGDMSIEPGGAGAEIRCRKSKFTLPSLPASTLERQCLPDVAGVTVPAGALVAVLESTSAAICTDETKPTMCGARFLMDGGDVVVVATDGGRMLVDALEATGELPGPFTVPKAGVSEVIKAFSGCSADVTVSCHDSFALFASDVTRISCTLSAGEFPDFKRVLDMSAAGAREYRLSRNDLLASVKRVSIALGEQQAPVRIAVSSDACIVSAPEAAGTSARDEIEIASGCDEQMTFVLNNRYVADALSAVEVDDIVFSSAGESRPVIIRSDLSPKFKALIMPMRT